MEKSKLFIFKTNSLSNDQYLLKLNRTDSCLEVYSKVLNSKLNEYYSIRSDFDSSEYTMFEKVDSMPCLFGGEKSPTPYGVFQVEKVSDNETVYKITSKAYNDTLKLYDNAVLTIELDDGSTIETGVDIISYRKGDGTWKKYKSNQSLTPASCN